MQYVTAKLNEPSNTWWDGFEKQNEVVSWDKMKKILNGRFLPKDQQLCFFIKFYQALRRTTKMSV